MPMPRLVYKPLRTERHAPALVRAFKGTVRLASSFKSAAAMTSKGLSLNSAIVWATIPATSALTAGVSGSHIMLTEGAKGPPCLPPLASW
eukprot:2985045-Amphidinium_carterae.1